MIQVSDRYRVDKEIGSGGMAVVYRAQDLKHNRPVAIKVMRPEVSAVMGRERFLSEIAFAARLQHPHVLALIDSGESQGQLYYVMPFLEGETLAQRIARETSLPVGEAMRIAIEVVSALKYAHDRGVLHRDIKPANVMLTGGHAVVMDFGIAKALDSVAPDLTATGVMVGTPAYMGPEHLDAKVDARSDIYSVGCMLYEMLAGAPPFTGPTAMAVLLRHLNNPVPELKNIPRHVELIVRRALEKNPDARFQDMPTLLNELQLASAGASTLRSAQSRPANLDAYDTYLRGIHSFDKRTETGNDRAITLLEEATKQDPTFAPAFAALAAAYVEKFFTYDPDPEWEERAFVAIEKARAIDPGLAKIYVVKGSLLWTKERRFPHLDAIDEFRRALAIDPDNPEALNELGKVLFHIGRLDEAVESFEHALAVDASFLNARFRLGLTEMLRGNFEKSLEVLRMLPVSSHGSSATAVRALNHHYLGRTDEGRRILANASAHDRKESDFHSVEAIFFALAGDREAAEKNIAKEIEISENLGHYHHAVAYIGSARAIMGEHDRAVDLLSAAADDGFPCYPWFERDPCLESVRPHPRFVALIGELKKRWGN